MIGRHHALCGTITGSLAAQYIHAPMHLYPLMVAVAAYGAILPDIDAANGALVWRVFPCPRACSRIVRAWSAACGLPEHRGLTHQILVQTVVSAVVAIPCGLYGVGWIAPFLLLGLLTHDAGDIPTLSGLCVTWPVKIRGRRDRVVPWPRALRFRVGSEVYKDGRINAPFEAIVLGAALPVAAVVFGVPGASGVTFAIGLHVWQSVLS